MAVEVENLTNLGPYETTVNGVVSNEGSTEGVLEKLMAAVNHHLEVQYTAGRITGTDYATVYLGAVQSALQQAVSFTLGMAKTNAEVALLGQKEITEYAQTQQTSNSAPAAASILGRQSTLYAEQANGFYNNAKTKHLKTLMDAYSVNITSDTPDKMTKEIRLPTTADANTHISKSITDWQPTKLSTS